MSLQEKFQIISPPNDNEDVGENQWVWPFSNNAAIRNVGEAGRLHRNNGSSVEEVVIETGLMPPGMEIGNTKYKRIEPMQLRTSGETDVSGDVNPTAFKFGFTRKEMKGADDAYTGEHIDHFYGEATGKDDTEQTYDGFVERNNYLDRI